MTTTPSQLVRQVETGAALPAGDEERFAGYGVMGLPFASGHVLALRRFPASSIGPGFTSVWHRHPSGNWAFFSDVDPGLSCSRFFGNALTRSERGAITLEWTDPWRLTITVPAAELTWGVELAETRVTRLLNGVAAALPAPLWRRPVTLAVMARVAGRALGAGELRLHGCTPNGHRFRAAPKRLWMIKESRARIGSIDLGEPGPLALQAHLGEFLIPQRGIFVIGSAMLESSPERCHMGGGHLLLWPL